MTHNQFIWGHTHPFVHSLGRLTPYKALNQTNQLNDKMTCNEAYNAHMSLERNVSKHIELKMDAVR